jgi:hypothetical protein
MNENMEKMLSYLMDRVTSLTELVNQFAISATQHDDKMAEQLRLNNALMIVSSPFPFPEDIKKDAQDEIERYIEFKQQGKAMSSAFK